MVPPCFARVPFGGDFVIWAHVEPPLLVPGQGGEQVLESLQGHIAGKLGRVAFSWENMAPFPFNFKRQGAPGRRIWARAGTGPKEVLMLITRTGTCTGATVV